MDNKLKTIYKEKLKPLILSIPYKEYCRKTWEYTSKIFSQETKTKMLNVWGYIGCKLAHIPHMKRILIYVLCLVNAGYAIASLGDIFAYKFGFDAEKKAADRGFAYYQNRVAEKYNSGDDVEPDKEKCLYYLKKAADNGQPAAQLGMAMHYIDKMKSTYRGSKAYSEHEQEFLRYARLSAEFGNLVAEVLLAKYYEAGDDLQKARYWYKRAISHKGTDNTSEIISSARDDLKAVEEKLKNK